MIKLLERTIRLLEGWLAKLKKDELLKMIRLLLNTAPNYGAVIMSYNNAKLLGMPETVLGHKVIVKDEGFPDNYILTGGD